MVYARWNTIERSGSSTMKWHKFHVLAVNSTKIKKPFGCLQMFVIIILFPLHSRCTIIINIANLLFSICEEMRAGKRSKMCASHLSLMDVCFMLWVDGLFLFIQNMIVIRCSVILHSILHEFFDTYFFDSPKLHRTATLTRPPYWYHFYATISRGLYFISLWLWLL